MIHEREHHIWRGMWRVPIFCSAQSGPYGGFKRESNDDLQPAAGRRLLLRADDPIAERAGKGRIAIDSSSSGGRQLRTTAEALRLSSGNSTSDPAGRE